MNKFDSPFLRAPDGDGAGGAAGAGGSGDGKGGATFDPVAFKTELTTELMAKVTPVINSGLNGIAKSLKSDFTKLFEGLKSASGDNKGGDGTGGDGDGAGGDGAGGDGKAKPKPDAATNARLQGLERTIKTQSDQIQALTASNETEKKTRLEVERAAAVRTVLAGIEFVDDASRDVFFRAHVNDIVRDDSGMLIAKTADSGDLPHDEYLRNKAKAMPALLAKKGDGGAGAGAGNKGAGGGGFNPNDITLVLDSKKWKALTDDQRAQVRQRVGEEAGIAMK